AYNKDMQEDKESVFDACETVKACLEVFTPMIQSMKVNSAAMLQSAKKGFMNATDLADYLVLKGLAFRDAYKISGSVVAYCIQSGTILEDLPLDEYKKFSPLIGQDVYEAIDLKNCVQKRISEGGTSVESVKKQLACLEEAL
ncbi:MAG: argininosuccinate lyase, partial [Spirochaetales bacterium]|nr:argininosuccinate lyase [Spirochaetales bacterium]